MLEKSSVVRKLTDTEVSHLITELKLFDNLWAPHNPKYKDVPTALRDGKTVHIQLYNPNTGIIDYSIFDRCPYTYKILSGIACSDKIGRCYWHRLLPGDEIVKHNDSNLLQVQNGSLSHRYQIYLNGDPDYQLEINEVTIDTIDWSNSVIDFALEKTHYYSNNSQQPWIFLVFDTIYSRASSGYSALP